MRTVRSIMQDRSSAGAVAALALLLFLFQGLASGFAHGSMTATTLASGDIICSAHMSQSGTTKPSPAGKLADSCCGTLCRLAAATSAALFAGPTEIPGPHAAPAAFIRWSFQEIGQSFRQNPRSQPRAPPHVLPA